MFHLIRWAYLQYFIIINKLSEEAPLVTSSTNNYYATAGTFCHVHHENKTSSLIRIFFTQAKDGALCIRYSKQETILLPIHQCERANRTKRQVNAIQNDRPQLVRGLRWRSAGGGKNTPVAFGRCWMTTTACVLSLDTD